MPAVLVHDRLMAEKLLTGSVPVPEEGSVLPDSYSFERGEARAAVLARMQAAMKTALAEEWARRKPTTVVKSPREALILPPRSSRRKPPSLPSAAPSPQSIPTASASA